MNSQKDPDSDALEAAVAARTAELEAALARKTTQLHEIDHRVKNNLQLISSLMLLQSRRMPDEAARHALKTMLERVTAVSTVHRRLFQGEDWQRFEVVELVRGMAGELAAAAGRDDLAIDLDLQPVAIAASGAAPFALIVNELLGNALKHAYPSGRSGRILVSIASDAGVCRLIVADEGQGMGDAQPGFGSTIVKLLCQQLHAELQTETGMGGVRTTVRVPVAPR